MNGDPSASQAFLSISCAFCKGRKKIINCTPVLQNYSGKDALESAVLSFVGRLSSSSLEVQNALVLFY